MTGAREIVGYQSLRLLGRGNTSWVYLALDARQRKVALKLPFPETLANPEAAERFANEVRVSLRLRHERLVVGYEGTHFGDDAFLTMRYFPEGTLSRWLELGQLSTTEGLRVTADLVAALTYLHRQGVVHQDVKAQNVYLDAGRAALGDFGAAYFTAQGGKTAGSPFYMAPEIYLGEQSTGKSDVYSLGVLAYEVLGHERPFRAASYDGLMTAHLNHYPRPLTHLNREVPQPLSRLVEHCLAKRPENRPDIVEVARLLGPLVGEALDGSDEAPPTPEPEAVSVARPAFKGRHGPAPEPRPVGGPSAPQAQEPDKRAWNPFKRRK